MMTDEKSDVIPYSCSSPSTIHHSITISGYSKFAQMPTASLLTVRKFRFIGFAWCIILYPNGSNETSADSISIKAVRHSTSDISVVHSDSGIDIAIQILDKSNKHALFYRKQMLGGHNFVFNPLIVKKTELEAASCLNEDSFTIACTLTFLLDRKQQQEEKGKITTIVGGDDPCPWNNGTTDD